MREQGKHKCVKLFFMLFLAILCFSMISADAAYKQLASKYNVILANSSSKKKTIYVDLTGSVNVSQNPSVEYYSTVDTTGKLYNSIAPPTGTDMTWYGWLDDINAYAYRNWTSKGGSVSGSWANNKKSALTLNSVDATASTPFIRLPKVSKAGYTFTGWSVTETQTPYMYFNGRYIKSSTKGSIYNPGVKKGSDGWYYIEVGAFSTIKTVKPTWRANNFYVRFHANGGSGYMADQTFTYGVSQNLRRNTFTRTGYTFSGWKVQREYDNKWAWAPGTGNGQYWQSGEPWGSDIRIYKDETSISATTYYGYANMYAQWNINSYTLTYNANGGSVSPTSKVLNYGAQYGTLPTPIRKGYTFDGWYTSPTGGSKVSSSTTMGASNTTIYAHWTNHKPEFSPEIDGTNPDNNPIPPFFKEDNVLVIQKNDKFTPENYITVDDKEDGNSIEDKLTIENHVPINDKNEAYQSGEYDVIYKATDEGGATGSYTLTVIVNEPPVIDATDRTFFKGQTGVDSEELLRKVTATDSEDGSLTDRIEIVQIDYQDGRIDKNVTKLDTSKTGSFTITYTVTDNYKKTVTKTATIKVIDNQSVVNAGKTGSIRFINQKYLNTIKDQSIWKTNDEYNSVLKDSLNSGNETAQKYSSAKIQSIRGE